MTKDVFGHKSQTGEEIYATLQAEGETPDGSGYLTVRETRVIFARFPTEARRAFWTFNDGQTSANHLFLDEVEEACAKDPATAEAFGWTPFDYEKREREGGAAPKVGGA